jgi:hypothetical protein
MRVNTRGVVRRGGASLLGAVIWLHCDVQRGSAQARRGTARADSIVILPGRIGSVRVCDSLARVGDAFPGRAVKDTLYSSEGSQWPAKRIVLKDGVIDFSSSWADTARVWNMSTTSPSVRSARGFHVGMRLGNVAALDSLEVELPEGMVVVSLKKEGIGALIDDGAQRRFYANYDFKGLPTAATLSPDAVITALLTGGGCE